MPQRTRPLLLPHRSTDRYAFDRLFFACCTIVSRRSQNTNGASGLVFVDVPVVPRGRGMTTTMYFPPNVRIDRRHHHILTGMPMQVIHAAMLRSAKDAYQR